ncbi:hypothetical protein PUN4_740003 [Paraburkholderia unamae]|nr:hypothetical protein PUN4_740003 [Paraburkholderia unamae]
MARCSRLHERLSASTIGLHRQHNIRRQLHIFDRLVREIADSRARKTCAVLSCRDVLYGEDVSHAAANELHVFPREVTHAARLRRENRAGRQYPESQQLGQVAGIRLVATVLKAIVLLDRRSIGQVHDEAGGLQPIHQPVPIVGPIEMFL